MRIGLSTTGLLPLCPVIETILGGKAKPLSHLIFPPDVVVGWGHKETALKARNYARAREIPYVAFEDGFLRSIHPGNAELPMSVVVDRSGIYYNSTQPSDLESLIRKRASMPDDRIFAKIALCYLRDKKLSKYNDFSPNEGKLLDRFESYGSDNVMVVDQTRSDASISLGCANAGTFEKMIEAAVTDNPGRNVIVKTHPETTLGRKAGHFNAAALKELAARSRAIRSTLSDNRLQLLGERVNPWSLLERCSKVYCVSSQLGFEALLAGCEVHCFGVPFYAGWGLTQDRYTVRTDRGEASLNNLINATYQDYSRYFDHSVSRFISFQKAAETLLAQRERMQDELI